MNLMLFKLKYLLKAGLERHGYSLQRLNHIKPLDVRARGNDPRSLLYRGRKQPVLINAPDVAGRGLPLFTFLPSGLHPFVRAVATALKNTTDEKSAIQSVLASYYNLVQPINAIELFGLESKEVPQLANEPSWAAILPWDEESISQWRKNHQTSVIMENCMAGRMLTISDGWAFCGPVTENKLRIETSRLYSLMVSIQRNGLKRHNGTGGDIVAFVLVRQDGQWRWLARTGQHRAAVLSALGFKNIPLRVVKIVNRDDVEIWPNVVSGVFSRSVALKLFDQIFEGALPPITQPWVDSVTNDNEA